VVDKAGPGVFAVFASVFKFQIFDFGIGSSTSPNYYLENSLKL